MNRDDAAHQDWRQRADARDLLETAKRFGAKLKRSGQEHIGPCVVCLGTDRFSVNPSKGKWNCRGAEGGSGAIGIAMHLGKLSYLQACELLTGQPNPSGRAARSLSDAELAAIEQRRVDAEAYRKAREAEQAAYEQNTREGAAAIWRASVPILGTLAETYLRSRGIDLADWPDELRFHSGLRYPEKPGTYPALVCRVDDLAGDLCAIWRIFLRGDGCKADVPDAKLGLGPAGGGAVRIGGVGPKVAIAEGVETALGYWLLTGRRYPTWASLSTAGMVAVEIPLGVDHVVIVPDGDRPMRKQGHEYVTAIPAGRKAALALRERLLGEGVGVTIAAEPPAGSDYLDVWNECREAA